MESVVSLGGEEMKTVNHVLMTADTVSGVWNYSMELARVLAGFEIKVSLATLGTRVTPTQRAEAKAIPNLDLYESSFKLEWMPEPWDEVRISGDWLLNLEDLLKPDIVHLNGYCHGALDWKSPTVVVCHSCVLSWWQAVRYERAPLEWICYEDEVRDGLRHAGAVVAPTEAMLGEIERIYGEMPKGRVIYNARDGEDFMPLAKEPFVLTVGRLWDEAKNISALDAVACEVEWPIYAAGESARETIECTHENIIGLGKLLKDDMAIWLGKASIYALPARYEPFGLSVLEAALAGCALVLGDIPSLREVWGDSALYIDPKNNDALRNTLNSLIGSPREVEALGEKARQRAQFYNPKRMGCDYLELYEELVSERPVAAIRSRIEFH
jgi:glycosyltransferase involved in cell wall biosynthesis